MGYGEDWAISLSVTWTGSIHNILHMETMDAIHTGIGSFLKKKNLPCHNTGGSP